MREGWNRTSHALSTFAGAMQRMHDYGGGIVSPDFAATTAPTARARAKVGNANWGGAAEGKTTTTPA